MYKGPRRLPRHTGDLPADWHRRTCPTRPLIGGQMNSRRAAYPPSLSAGKHRGANGQIGLADGALPLAWRPECRTRLADRAGGYHAR